MLKSKRRREASHYSTLIQVFRLVGNVSICFNHIFLFSVYFCYSEYFVVIPITAWYDETMRGNMIMGDVADTYERLLAPDGIDYRRLTKEEQEANDTSRFAHTDHDRRVLRHFEGAAEAAKMLCMFLQDENNACVYVLFYFRVIIKETSAPTMAIYKDISRMVCTKDLRNRGEKTVLARTTTRGKKIHKG